ncbi:MAG: peptide chain release factor N(5)-glutamine methyltransferase [Thermoanaerobaculia bacterium]|nr:peptide chain release factor N(5)-glutamine methyltransferase [Thermoanaerobaculia bacterium]
MSQDSRHETNAAPTQASDVRTVDDLLTEGRLVLRASRFRHDDRFDVEPREAAYLLAHVLAVREVQVRAFGEREVDGERAAHYLDLVRRRASGEPAAYLVGHREFYGREFRVDPRVLIPRPETEHLIEAVLALDLPVGSAILDVGTGSGCIAATLALETSARIVATDLSLDALEVARCNARRLGAKVHFLRTDLLSGLCLDTLDLVVSNPPYVSPEALPTLSPEVTEHEPHLALFAPKDGTQVVERLLGVARTMRTGSWMVLEIGHDQGSWLERRIEGLEHLTLARLILDYGGRPRTAVLQVT